MNPKDPFFSEHACLTGDCPHEKQVECFVAAWEQGRSDGIDACLNALKSEDCAQMCNAGIDPGRFGIMWKSPLVVASWLENSLRTHIPGGPR